MIEKIEEILNELKNDSTEYGKKQALKLEKYISQLKSGEISKEEFLIFVSDLANLNDSNNAFIETKTKALMQNLKTTCTELLSLLR